MIRLVALDIDGTLLTSQKTLTARTRQAIEKLNDRKIAVALVTGRTFPATMPVARALDIDDLLVVAHNGALVKQLGHNDPIATKLLPAHIARRAIREVSEKDVNLSCSDDPFGPGRLVLDRPPSDRLKLYLQSVGMKPLIVESLDSFVDHPVIQVSVSGPTSTVENIQDRLEAMLTGQVSLTKTSYPHRNLTILDVLQAGCSKRSGLVSVVDYLSLRAEDVLAVGDNFNDLEMLEYAGKAVVMANAPAPLHQLGFESTADRDHDGAALAIERFVLSQPKP